MLVSNLRKNWVPYARSNRFAPWQFKARVACCGSLASNPQTKRILDHFIMTVARPVLSNKATLHFSVAFWGMLLPVTVHGRVSDIWRSYFTQALLPVAGAVAAFAPPWVQQVRAHHNIMYNNKGTPPAGSRLRRKPPCTKETMKTR